MFMFSIEPQTYEVYTPCGKTTYLRCMPFYLEYSMIRNKHMENNNVPTDVKR